MNKATCIPTQQLACSDNGFVSSRSRMNIVLHAFSFLTVVLYSSKLFTDSKQELTCEVGTPPAKNESGNEIIKLCNGILYRLMIDSGEPPFPEKACDIKQKVITCFENEKGSGNLLDEDRFLLLQSSIVDKALMCPEMTFDTLQSSIQNSAVVKQLFSTYPTVMAPPTRPEQCAIDIHKNCEKQIFDQMVVNHIPWPKTTKWRDCYNKALKETPCTASILLNYATLQQKFGENLRTTEYCQGLFGIFMNDNHQPLRI